MKYQIKRYNDIENYHLCWNEKEGEVRIDLRCGGQIPKELSSRNLIGRTVEITRKHPHVFIADELKLLNEETPNAK